MGIVIGIFDVAAEGMDGENSCLRATEGMCNSNPVVPCISSLLSVGLSNILDMISFGLLLLLRFPLVVPKKRYGTISIERFWVLLELDFGCSSEAT